MTVEVIMPKLGESITEGTILEWKKQVGDAVVQDETILEISTDKVDSEVPSPATGILQEILFQPNDVVDVGTIIARIADQNTEVELEVPVVESELPPSLPESSPEKKPEKNQTLLQPGGADRRYYSPLVKSIAHKEGIDAAELARVPGTGSRGRVTKKDILDYLHQRQSPAAISIPGTPTGLSGRVEKMNRVRKLIADHMIASQRTSAHVYSTSEVDVTPLVEYRQAHKDRFRERYGFNLTFTPMIIEATIRALSEFPLLNASIKDDEIIHHGNINMGVAVTLPNDNLIVPVIKRAETLNFLGLAQGVADLANRARDNRLNPDEIADSTFSVTNPGMFGSLFGMAIINQPNVGILSVGTIQKRPVVRETEYGDVIVPRQMMYLTLGYDHRLIDGAYGTRFTRRLVEILSQYLPEGI